MNHHKVAVITGGTRGLGNVLVETFLKEGWRVAALARNVKPLPDSENCLFLKADVTEVSALEKAVAAVVQKWGRIDVWINNAGRGKMMPFVGNELEWAEIFNVNFWGVVNGCRAALPALLKNENGGAIINIASLAGIQVCPHHSAYGVSKAAVIALTRSLAVEYAADNIRVNAIAPGPLDTEGFRAAGGDPRQRAQSIPTRKMMTLQEIAEASLFLAKPLPSMTGHTLVMDGASSAVGCYITNIQK